MSEIFQQSLNQQNYGSVNTVNKQELTRKLDLIQKILNRFLAATIPEVVK